MIIAGLWRYGDWRHVTTGCNPVVTFNKHMLASLHTVSFTNFQHDTLLRACLTF